MKLLQKIIVLDSGEVIPYADLTEEEHKYFTEETCDLLCVSTENTLTSSIQSALGNIFPINPKNEKRINLILTVVESYSPQHFGEVMLIIQMCMAYEMSLKLYGESFSRALTEDVERSVNLALKLSRSCNATAENLAKMRRNGEQKVIVEHKGGRDV